MKKISLLFLLSVNILFAVAQSSPKREIRSGWLATVWKLDWPARTIYSTGDPVAVGHQQQELKTILDKMKSANVNSVFFQVRSRSDAMYKSSFEPWSTDLVGTRGLDPGYDPLQFAIEEAHKRGMELHAWINPYRFESVTGQWAGMKGDYATSNPDWVVSVPTIKKNPANPAKNDTTYSSILDPGRPEVRTRIADIVGEIVTNYDLDGIVFDDYFYIQGIKLEDSASANAYKPADMPLGDWRRGNVDQMISDVYTRIKSIKKHVQFGVSPAGVWTTNQAVADKYGVELPKKVTGGYAYEGIYCDPLAWMKAKTIDYISPQIYWSTKNATAPYTPLSEWWSDMANLFDVQFYSSISLSEMMPVPTTFSAKAEENYTIGSETIPEAGMSGLEREIFRQLGTTHSDLPSTRINTIPASDYLIQIANNRDFDRNGAPGSVFYSVKSLLKVNFPAYLTKNIFQNKSLRPALWSLSDEESFVTNIQLSGNVLTWTYAGAYPRFTVYAIPNSELSKVGNFAKSDYLLDVVYGNTYSIPTDKPSSSYTYAVCVLDRSGNEFSAKIMGTETIKTGAAPSLLFPANNGSIVIPDNFEWVAQADAEFYIFEIASDASFNSIIYKRELTKNTFPGFDLKMLKNDVKYYWRVTTRRISTKDAVSSINAFTPTVFSITYPLNGATEVGVTPMVEWASVPVATMYKLEIASNKSFAASTLVLTENVSDNKFTVPSDVLQYNATYYARATASVSGSNVVSPIVSFSTEEGIPPVPPFLSPANGSTVTSLNLPVKWSGSNLASGYRLELHTDKDFFPTRNTIVKTTSAFVYEVDLTSGLTPGATYYMRVRANYPPAKYTDWSEVFKVTFDPGGASIEGEQFDAEDCYIYSIQNEKYLVVNADIESILSADLYNISGMKVANIVKNHALKGERAELLIPSDVLSSRGVYLIRVSLGTKSYILKFIN